MDKKVTGILLFSVMFIALTAIRIIAHIKEQEKWKYQPVTVSWAINGATALLE